MTLNISACCQIMLSHFLFPCRRVNSRSSQPSAIRKCIRRLPLVTGCPLHPAALKPFTASWPSAGTPTQTPGQTSRSSVCRCAAALMNLTEAVVVVFLCSPREQTRPQYKTWSLFQYCHYFGFMRNVNKTIINQCFSFEGMQHENVLFLPLWSLVVCVDYILVKKLWNSLVNNWPNNGILWN